MGLPLAGASSACSKPADVPVVDPATGVVGAHRKDVRRSDAAPGAWHVWIDEPPHKSDLPSCPSGTFCVAGKHDGAKGAAAAPFESCAATVAFPHEKKPDAAPGGPAWVGGPDVNDVQSHYAVSFDPGFTRSERRDKDPNACCYHWYEPCPGGRPLRDPNGNAVVAPLVETGTRLAPATARDEERGRRWARAAQFEHASIASFAEFSLALLALGAPLDLVARAHEAALDEVQHARLAFGLAAAFAHCAVGPGALDAVSVQREVSPEHVLVSTIRDGCVAETRAALDARRDSRDAATDEEREVLTVLARDEERHAELAFATVAWIVARFGAPVRRALSREIERLETLTDPVVCDIVVPCLRLLEESERGRMSPVHARATPSR
jgi:hypothetical protein